MLKHELAYVLGQMQNSHAVPALIRVLQGQHEPMVRHEAAEALGAIGQVDCLDVLNHHWKNDPEQCVRETCELAVGKILDEQEKKKAGFIAKNKK